MPACSAATASGAELVARLGPEAGDILDEFLNFCLAQEKTGTPGPRGVPGDARKRGARDQARDGPGPRRGAHHDGACRQGPGGAGRVPRRQRQRGRSASSICRACCRSIATGKLWQGKGYLWRAAGDIANGNSRAAAARIKEAAEEEYRRLLYVGMTRAEDRLIVCGYSRQASSRPPAPGMRW